MENTFVLRGWRSYPPVNAIVQVPEHFVQIAGRFPMFVAQRDEVGYTVFWVGIPKVILAFGDASSPRYRTDDLF
jgi:hypothetical protein